MNDLFSSLNLGGISLPNRIFMAPLTRNRAVDGLATSLMATYYSQRSSAGLIISEGSQISAQAVGYSGTPGIYTDEQSAAWKTVVDAVHKEEGHIFCQLWHCGRISHPDFHNGNLPVAPSAIKPEGQTFTADGLKDFEVPRALDLAEIPAIIEQYCHAALTAIDAGFDGVEIHAANGYLIDQFLRDKTNQRSDSYGGSIKNRTRLLLEIVKAVGNAIGFNKVGVRISPVNKFNNISDSNPQALFNYVAEQLNQFEPAYLHVVEVSMVGESSEQCDMKQLRQCFKGLYIANGGYDKASGHHAINKGTADAIAFGSKFLANPDLPARLHAEVSLNEADPNTFYGGNEQGFTDYPSLNEG
ncbi:MAG: alkene reductase [Methylococcales bacterium]